MRTLKPNSKHARKWVEAYYLAKYSCLEQVYRTYSREKGLAYRACRKMMQDENGKYFRIVSFNSTQFTAGWATEKGIRIVTRNNSFLIPW